MSDEKLKRFRQMRSMTEAERTALAIEYICEVCSMVSSAELAEVMLAQIRRQPPEIFWPVFFQNWPSCDDTWYLRDDLLWQLQRNEEAAPGVNFLCAEARAAYDALPDQVKVFRGSSRERVMGISWTTDRDIAIGFAQGHRGRKVTDPVIASGVVPKWALYGVCIDRGEADVILDPQYVDEIELEGAPAGPE